MPSIIGRGDELEGVSKRDISLAVDEATKGGSDNNELEGDSVDDSGVEDEDSIDNSSVKDKSSVDDSGVDFLREGLIRTGITFSVGTV
jgi:hypothetical protein